MYIGIDIGGTNVRVAVVADGKILHLVKESTAEGVKTAGDFLQKLVRMIESIPNHRECKAIGIGVPGMIVDNKITTCRNFKVLVGYPLALNLEKHFKKPVHLQNDAKLATLGEALAGAGSKFNSVAYVGLGTGLGGGTVVNKKLFLGASCLGGYFSRIILDGAEIAENLVAGVGLSAQIQTALGQEMSIKEFFAVASSKTPPAVASLGNGKPTIVSNVVDDSHPLSVYNYEALKSLGEPKNSVYGHKALQGVLANFQRNLANLLLNISVTLNPDAIILGGGIMDSSVHFIDAVIKDFRTRAHDNAKQTQILRVSLEYPGVIGATLFAQNPCIF